MRLDCLFNRLFKRRSKKNIKAQRYWPLGGKSTGHRWIPPTTGHLMTSLWHDREMLLCISVLIAGATVHSGHIETQKFAHGFQHQFFSRDGYVVFFDEYCVTVSDLVSTIPTLEHPFYVYMSSRFLSSMSSPCDRVMHLLPTVSLCSMPYCANYNSVSLLYRYNFCTMIYKCARSVI